MISNNVCRGYALIIGFRITELSIMLLADDASAD